jgi:hypothetical protein
MDSQEQLGSPVTPVGILGVLTLSTLPVRSSRLPSIEPLDYSKSILLTSDDYLMQMEKLAAKRNDAARSRDTRKLATKERKRKREEERVLQLQKKKERDEAKAEKARERAYWGEVVSRGWGNDLQACMKSSLPPPPGAYTSIYIGSVPAWCIANQRRQRRMLDLRRGRCSGQESGAGTAGLHEGRRGFVHGPGLHAGDDSHAGWAPMPQFPTLGHPGHPACGPASPMHIEAKAPPPWPEGAGSLLGTPAYLL